MNVVDGYRARVPAADVSVLEGVGHYAMLEDPAGTLAAFSTFQRSIASYDSARCSRENGTP